MRLLRFNQREFGHERSRNPLRKTYSCRAASQPVNKLAWYIPLSALAFILLAAGLSAYVAFTLQFDQKVDCATGEPSYGFLTPACRIYLNTFSKGDTKEEREQMSSNLHRLMTAYSLNSQIEIGENALNLADRFIERGADVNFVDKEGGTPLHTAVLHGDKRLVRFLLSRGADANQSTHVHFLSATLSPLMLARNIKQKGNDEQKWDAIIMLLKDQALTSDE